MEDKKLFILICEDDEGQVTQTVRGVTGDLIMYLAVAMAELINKTPENVRDYFFKYALYVLNGHIKLEGVNETSKDKKYPN